jgi:hypothetical protein
MLDKLVDPAKKITMWLSSKANRLRLQGARIEVMMFLLSRNPQPSILLGQSPYHSMWMPPQEGVGLAESFEDAVFRCLRTECGLKLPENIDDLHTVLHLRSIRFMGEVMLPKERHGERLVADDAHGSVLETVMLKKKAYWLATLLVGSQNDISPLADGRELIDIKWFDLKDAEIAIRETNHNDKANFLIRCLESCRKDLVGAARL